jgi:DNA-directed RNA polymerase specialized sigma24 family protein
MERAQAIEELPEAYARALSLRDKGVGAEVIAAELGIVPEAVSSMLRLADAKLARLMENGDGGPN